MRVFVHFVCVIVLLLHFTFCIRLPGLNVDKDTLNTLGIKTIGWQDEDQDSFSQVHMHHNYSKVSVQNEEISSVSQYSNSGKNEDLYQSQIGGQTLVDEDDYVELPQEPVNLDQIQVQQQESFGGQNLEQNESLRQTEFTGQQTVEGQNDYDDQSTSSSNNQQIYNAHGYGNVLQLNQVMEAESDLKGQQLYEDYEDYDLGQLQLVDQSVDASTNLEQQERQSKQFYPLDKPIYIHGYKYPPDPEDVYPLNKPNPKPTAEIYSKCPKMATGQFVHAESCNKFLNCWKGRGFVQNCAPGTLFNPKTLECDFASKVKCLTGPRESNFDENQQVTGQKLEISCPADFSGLVPHHSDCSKFINCANGVEYVMDCPPGTLFSLKINNCDHPYKAECASWSVSFGNVSQSNNNGGSNYGQTYQGGQNTYYQSGHKYSSSDDIRLQQGKLNQNQGGSSGFNTNNFGSSGSGSYQGQGTNQDLVGSQSQYIHGNQGHYGQNQNIQGQTQYYQGQSQGLGSKTYEGQDQQAQNVYENQNIYGSKNLEGETQYNQGQNLHGNQDAQGQATSNFEGQTHYNQEHSHGSQDFQGQNQYQKGHESQNQGQYIHGSTNLQGHSNFESQTQYNQEHSQGHYAHSSQDFQGQNQYQQGHGTTNLEGQTQYNQKPSQGHYAHGSQDFQGQNEYQQGHKTTNLEGQYVHGSTDLQGQYNLGKNQDKDHEGKYLEGQYVQENQNLQGQPQPVSSGFGAVKCPHDFTGLYPHPSDCSKFVNCANGQSFVQDCGPGTVFNPESKVCDFPYKVKCSNSQGRNTHSQYSEQGQSHTSANAYHETLDSADSGLSIGTKKSIDAPAKCPQDASGLYPHPTICSKFLNCANGQTFIQDCGPGTVFNPVSKVCDFPYNVECGATHGEGLINIRAEPATHNQSENYGNQGNINQQGSYAGQGGNEQQTTYSHNQAGQTSATGQQQQGFYGQNTNLNNGASGASHGQTHNSGANQQGLYGQGQNQNNYQHSNGQSSSTDQEQQSFYGQNQHDVSGSSHSQTHNSGANQQGLYGPGQNQNNHQSSDDINQAGQSSSTDQQQQGLYGQNQHGTSHGQTHNSGVNQQGLYGQGQNQNNHQSSTGHNQAGQSSSTNQQQQGFYGQNQHDVSGTSHDQTHNSGANQQGLYGQDQNQNNRQSSTGINQAGQSSATDQQHQGFYGQNQHDVSGTSHGQTHNSGVNQQGQNNHQSSDGINQAGQSSATDQQHQGFYGQNQHDVSGTSHGQTHNSGANQQGLYGQAQNKPQGSYGLSSGQPQEVYGPNHGSYGFSQNSGPNQQVKPQSSYGQSGEVQEVQETKNFNQQQYGSGTSKQFVVGHTHHSPAPFPSTDINADYEFGNEGPVEVSPLELSKPKVTIFPFGSRKRKDFCEASDFYCSIDDCLPQSMVCDNIKDCPDGRDEQNCEKYMQAFTLTPNTILAVREKEKFMNISLMYCAKTCLESKSFQCKSFSYRKDDGACFLTDTNVGHSGALIISHRYSYYELSTFSVNCTNLYKCPNQKCINFKQVCDGINDCGDRSDERGCNAKAFGYQIRFGGTDKKYEGRIELKAFGRWGYVCDDKFGLRDADVACRELGFPLGALEVKSNSYYDQDLNEEDVFYLMDDVTCLGNETTLRDCDFNGWGVNNCESQEIVGVVCKTPLENCPKDYWKCDAAHECIPLAFMCDGVYDCTDQSDESNKHCEAPVQMRLVEGQAKTEGRLEIRYHGIWGTVCDDDFNDDSAKVVCKSLGYPGRAAAKKDGYFGPGKGPIWLDQVFCQGNESSLEYCVHWDWGEHNCEHGEDVGVICSNSFDDIGNERNVKIEPRHNDIKDVIPQYLFPQRCGLRKDDQFLENDEIHFRVVKGSIARKGDYPWQASVRIKNKSKPTHWCGAVVISQKFVLTAAHCLAGFAKGAYFIVAGDYNTDDDEGTEQEAYIEEFYVHEEFRSVQKMNNDIALVKLKGQGFTFTKDVQPICMPDSDLTYEPGLNCTISGFGTIESGKAGYSHQLRAGWVPIQSRAVCQMPHVYGTSITDGMICAGSLDEGVDACDGDSGGPLACLHDGHFTLYGLTSWGHHCGHANKPGVYVKVSHYRNWIDETIKKHS